MLEAKRFFLSAFSVRARMVALALIPVGGFLANGIAFKSGEADVQAAFANVNRAAALSDASHNFKVALADMQFTVRDFASNPNGVSVRAFDKSRKLAARSLDRLEGWLSVPERQEVVGLRARLDEVAYSFGSLVKEQERLGFSAEDGIRKELQDAKQAIDHFVNVDISRGNAVWQREPEAQELLVSLLNMRRHGADYRLLRKEYLEQLFASEFAKFGKIAAAVNMPAALKDRMLSDVRTYAQSLRDWSEAVDKIEPYVALINSKIEQMLPAADGIIQMVQKGAARSSQALTVSQNRTKIFMIWVGIAAVLLGLGFSWLIGRSVTRPLNGLGAAMKRLADGDTTGRIPATNLNDEIGAMARTVIVFRDTMIEQQRLAMTEEETSRSRESAAKLLPRRLRVLKAR